MGTLKIGELSLGYFNYNLISIMPTFTVKVSAVLMLVLAIKLSTSASDCDEAESKVVTTPAPVTVHNSSDCDAAGRVVTTPAPVTVHNSSEVCLNSTSPTLAPGDTLNVLNLDTLDSCTNQADGTFMTDTRHCRRYYICQSGRARRLRCSLTQWFDRATASCRDRSLVTNCPSNRS